VPPRERALHTKRCATTARGARIRCERRTPQQAHSSAARQLEATSCEPRHRPAAGDRTCHGSNRYHPSDTSPTSRSARDRSARSRCEPATSPAPTPRRESARGRSEVAVRIDADPAGDQVRDAAVGSAKRHADIDQQDAAGGASGVKKRAARELGRHIARSSISTWHSGSRCSLSPTRARHGSPQAVSRPARARSAALRRCRRFRGVRWFLQPSTPDTGASGNCPQPPRTARTARSWCLRSPGPARRGSC
jgi:hypothetical protein